MPLLPAQASRSISGGGELLSRLPKLQKAVAASMPQRMLCRDCLGGEYHPGNKDVYYFPTRVVEEACRDGFANRLAYATFEDGEVPTDIFKSRHHLDTDSIKVLEGGSYLLEKLKQDAGGWHDTHRVEISLAAGRAWLTRMEAIYASDIVYRKHSVNTQNAQA